MSDSDDDIPLQQRKGACVPFCKLVPTLEYDDLVGHVKSSGQQGDYIMSSDMQSL
jgi:hypothetical protein